MKTVKSDLQCVSAFEVYKNQNINGQQKKKKKAKRTSAQKIVQVIKKQIEVPLLNERVTNELTKIRKKHIKNGKNLSKIQTNQTMKIKKQTDSHVQNNVFNLNDSSDNPLSDALQTFKWLIEPVSPDDFFKLYWEQKVLYIKRSNENYYSHIFNSTILDKIIRNNRLNYTENVDVVSYENGVKEVHNPEGKANPSALWDYYSNGCSIRILNPQTYCNKVHLLLATLQEYFGTMVGANVYLTPPNSQGFAPHYDDIEAFVVQLEGRKHWKLYHPSNSNVLARFSSPNLNHEDIGKPFMELTLNAGEVLYFPRGTIHEGSTDADSHSLHITVSVYQQTSFTDLLQLALPLALKRASETDINFRKGLPLNYLKHFGAAADDRDSDFRNSFKKTVGELLQSLFEYVDEDLVADLLGKKFMHDSMPPVLSKEEMKRCSKGDGPVLNKGQVINKVGIELNTRIRLLRYYCIRLVVEYDSNSKLYYNTENANFYHGEEEQWLELEDSMIPVIRLLQKTYPRYIEVDQLPMEDEELKMQLISDLWEHGLIVTEQPLLKCTDNK